MKPKGEPRSVTDLTPQDLSLMTSAVVSVIRDRAISSSYNYLLSQSIADNSQIDDIQANALLLDVLFDEKLSERIRNRICEAFDATSFSCPLFGTEGDLLSQLYRLFSVTREFDDFLAPYTAGVEKRISEMLLFSPRESHVSDGKHLRHLRNAICHCRFETLQHENRTQIVFTDYDIRNNQITAVLALDVLCLNEIIDALISDVFIRVFKDVGWTIQPPQGSDTEQ